MADARDLKSLDRKVVRVRLPPWAPRHDFIEMTPVYTSVHHRTPVRGMMLDSARLMERVAHYNAYLLAGRITLQALRNASHLRDAFQHYSAAVHAEDCKRPPEQIALHLNKVSDVLHAMAYELALLVRAVATEWDRTRHAADAKKFNASPYMRQRGAKGILPILSTCDTFLNALQAQVYAGFANRPPAN